MKQVNSWMLLILLIVSVLSISHRIYDANALLHTTEWIYTYGGTGEEWVNSLIRTSDGGYAIVGCTDSYGTGGYDILMVKTYASGEIAWTKTYGGSGDETANSIVQTSDGGYILAGYTTSFGVGGKSTTQSGKIARDVWIVKLDALGNKQWSQTFGNQYFTPWGTSTCEWANSIAQTYDGGYIIAGAHGGQGTNLGILSKYWLIKTDFFGNEQWNVTFRRSGMDRVESVSQTNDGGYILLGNDWYAHGGPWLIKTNSDGEVEWDNFFEDNLAFSVIQTVDGGYAFCGLKRWVPGKDWPDFWLVKTDVLGNTEWQKNYDYLDSDSLDEAYSLEQTIDNGYIIAGHTQMGEYPYDYDFWLVKTDVNGNMEWDETIGNPNDDEYKGYIVEINNGEYVLAGTICYSPTWEGDFIFAKVIEDGSSTIQPPSAPQDLSAEPVGYSIKLSWNAPTDSGNAPVDTYEVYRGDSSGGETHLISIPGDTLEYIDMAISTYNLYYYYVKAVNSAGESPSSNEIKCSNQMSITGLTSSVNLESFRTSSRFTIQQNFFLYGGNQEYWIQNIIMANKHGGLKMAGFFEIWNKTVGANKAKVLHWLYTYRSDLAKDNVILRSTIEGNSIILKNDFSEYEWQIPELARSGVHIGWGDGRTIPDNAAPELVVVGEGPIVIGDFKWGSGLVEFQHPTSGSVNSYCRVGDTWLSGKNAVIRPPKKSSTYETSKGLEWTIEGDFQDLYGAEDQGLWFIPDFDELIASPPDVSPPPPPSPSIPITSIIRCPVNQNLFDTQGRHVGYNTTTGEVDENIPDTFYLVSQEAQAILIMRPSDVYRLILAGTDDGIYTLEISQIIEDGSLLSLWDSTQSILAGEVNEYVICTHIENPFVVEWDQIFEDSTRGTSIRISTKSQYFQFDASEETFSLKHDPNLFISRQIIIIHYEDDEIRLHATANIKLDFCIAFIENKLTGDRYFLLDKPDWRGWDCHNKSSDWYSIIR